MLLSALPDPNVPIVRALNLLLDREPWAKKRIAAHAGKTVRIRISRLDLRFTLGHDGGLARADPAVISDVALTIPDSRLSEVPAALRNRQDPAQLASLLHLEGDASLAQLVSELARDLRWDSEHELARFTGGMLSKQIHLLLQRAIVGTTAIAGRLSENVSEYVSEEAGMVLGKPALHAWENTLRTATVQLDQLDARLRALEARQRRSGR
ncbi:hypothetical protein CAP48_05030 [Advenella sp. S44]|uniref:ubiquinone biosynthesis accessory factor UbiJ n=1 Tax=Advenella sp. S44 TaxID=1982755 RepID=UPI000C2AE649|nr:SCP2 sterol-binding domain-containing protein [Advenella sp. S44]PJX25420.1 hypothetical protein CAP48_05030 [Advenella sp. S44]